VALSSIPFSNEVFSLALSRYELAENLNTRTISEYTPHLGRESLTTSPRRVEEIALENLIYVFTKLKEVFYQYRIDLPILDSLRKNHEEELRRYSSNIDKGIDEILKKYRDNPKKRFNETLKYLESLRAESLKSMEEGRKIINDLILESNLPAVLLSNFKMFIDLERILDEKVWEIAKKKMEAQFNVLIAKSYPRGRKEVAMERRFKLIEREYRYDELKQLMRIERLARLSFITLIYILCIPRIKSKEDYFKVGLKFVSWPDSENYRKAAEHLWIEFREYLFMTLNEAARYFNNANVLQVEITNKSLWRDIVSNIIT